MTEPKPCPFCGSSKVKCQQGSTFRWRHAICEDCGAEGPEVRIQTVGVPRREDWEAEADGRAIAEWNQRI